MQHPFSQVQCLFFLKCLTDPNPKLPVRTWSEQDSSFQTNVLSIGTQTSSVSHSCGSKCSSQTPCSKWDLVKNDQMLRGELRPGEHRIHTSIRTVGYFYGSESKLPLVLGVWVFLLLSVGWPLGTGSCYLSQVGIEFKMVLPQCL